MSYIERNQALLDEKYQTIWTGATVDSCGSKGGLLPEYRYQSSWLLVEHALRTIWAFAKRIKDAEEPSCVDEAV